jgi:hypothetical protein
MLRPTEAKAEEARRKARDLFQRDRAKDAEAVKEREKAFAAQSEKTAKLRALRLARDAQDEAAAAEAKTAATTAKAAAKKRAKAAKPD